MAYFDTYLKDSDSHSSFDVNISWKNDTKLTPTSTSSLAHLMQDCLLQFLFGRGSYGSH
jgi:hypothetical protein